MKVTKEYLDLLKERIEYFKDKKIGDLERSEIQEYLNLQEEVMEAFPAVRNFIFGMVEGLREVMEPHYEAMEQYQERVINKK
ncbi:peptide ABC transporter permease [Oceanobacillus picturae]|uniref:Peptide ABC transporter permease n=1 Tax=Oceanobacillus picturae TaxID=171693 RepID=A0A0U9H7R3_9BACI|nr:hypothetical protein [Oceanobacillus picturae]GAQ18016.1 peptide ABC transporter permease [Oceanobacillus picturae]